MIINSLIVLVALQTGIMSNDFIYGPRVASLMEEITVETPTELVIQDAVKPYFEISFEWNANAEPDLAGYRIYESQNSGEYDNWVIQIKCAATETFCTEATRTLEKPGTYYWVATAFDTDGNESCYSEELTHTFITLMSPKNLKGQIKE